MRLFAWYLVDGMQHMQLTKGDVRNKRKAFRIMVCVVLLVLTVFPSAAQHEIRFDRITVEDGLSQSAITDMIQDKYGYLWIGTLDGLNRYDGRSFTVYRGSDNAAGLPSGTIDKLFLDDQGNVWISYGGGISRYDMAADEFINYAVKDSAHRDCTIRKMVQLSDSVMLLATNNGVWALNTERSTVVEANGFTQFKNRNIVTVLRSAANGTLLVTDSEAWLKPVGALLWRKILEDAGPLVGFHDEAADEFYIQSQSSVLRYDAATQALATFIAFTPAEDFDVLNFGMYKTSRKEWWLFGQSIYIYNENGEKIRTLKHQPNNPNSLSGSYFSRIYETKDGVIWVGTLGLGLSKYNPSISIFNYLGFIPSSPLSLSAGYVTCVYTDDDDHIYTGTLEGLDVLTLKDNTTRHYRITDAAGRPTRINRIVAGADGVLLLGTNKGLMTFAAGVIHNTGAGLASTAGLEIYDMANAGSDKVVLATKAGIYSWHTRTSSLKQVSTRDSRIVAFIDGQYWIESDKRIVVIGASDNSEVEMFGRHAADSGQLPASVKCFYKDRHNRVWMGTWGSGLGLLDASSRRFTYYKEASGLPSSVVYAIQEDASGHLWMSTNNGICVFDPVRGKSLRNFSKRDGLQGNEFNTNAYWHSPAGIIYFGGVNGLTFFDPASALQIPSFVPKTILKGFYINNVKVSRFRDGRRVSEAMFGEKIVLEYSERNFSVDVEGMGFTFPSGTRCKYILETFDDAWNEIGEGRRITFTNVPPGTYTLRIKSANIYGDWEKAGIATTIVVKSPFWRAFWFRGLLLVMIGATVVLIYKQRTKALKVRAAYLAGQVRERTREIRIQQEEIRTQNEELQAQSDILELRNRELEAIKLSLERRVDERTSTLKKVNEELVGQNIQLEQFSFITAHNIRGPIARIKGLIYLLAPDDKDEILGRLRDSVDDLDDVISDLMLILNIQKGFKTFEPVALREQLAKTLSSLDDEIKTKGAQIDVDDFGDFSIPGHAAYVQSVFYNLISNALKYCTAKSMPVVKISSRLLEDAIVVVIEDNGIGIDMTYAEGKIFKLYQRFHDNAKGKGFGLFLVKTQVESMNGRIEIQSSVGQGTKFIIKFPRLASGADAGELLTA